MNVEELVSQLKEILYKTYDEDFWDEDMEHTFNKYGSAGISGYSLCLERLIRDLEVLGKLL